MTVQELGERMSSWELQMWMAHDTLTYKEQQHASAVARSRR